MCTLQSTGRMCEIVLRSSLCLPNYFSPPHNFLLPSNCTASGDNLEYSENDGYFSGHNAICLSTYFFGWCHKDILCISIERPTRYATQIFTG